MFRPAPPPPQPPSPRRNFSLIGWLLRWTFVAAIWATLAVGAVVGVYSYDLPDISQVAQSLRRPSVTILAADGTLIARYGDLHGATLTIADLPPALVQAVLATEDRRFYHHFGIDPIGLVRAALTNWRSGRLVQGGSTITQQLAKNLFLTPARNFKRKVQEAVLALWLEHLYSKDQILAAYLNRVYLGAGAYGVDAAAQTYFAKPARDLTIRESATIAGLLKAPSRYSPIANPAAAAERTAVVLQNMVDVGYLAPKDLTALNDPLSASNRRSPGGASEHYFADWIADQVSDFVGPDHADLVVRTTLDPRLQQAAEARIRGALQSPQAAKGDAAQAALVTLAPDGAVRALIGGAEYHDSQFNRATQAMRQPGSSFKPFIYLAALDTGLTADSLVDDAPISVHGWHPANFEKEFRGPMPLRNALAYSINTASVRVLLRAGIDKVRSLARRLGITAPLGHDLSLALGTSEVTLLELTSGYAGLADRGHPVRSYGITTITDNAGAVLYQRQHSDTDPVAPPEQIAALTRMMMGVIEFGTGKAARLDRPAAGKTGTSQDYRDAWFVGFTADYVCGVWIGNDDGTPMKRVVGGSIPARLWHDVMSDAEARLPRRTLPNLEQEATVPLMASDGEAAGPDNKPAPHSPVSGAQAATHAARSLFQRLTDNVRIEYEYPKDK
ncbi:MAG: PBP1A family penicillin-binding protein [Azospirillaceae bacterium]|nr:PBP1A family penicillin-binding protein [Azospirillaceae bacterium]